MSYVKAKHNLSDFKKDEIIEFVALYCPDEVNSVRLNRVSLMLEQRELFKKMQRLEQSLVGDQDELDDEVADRISELSDEFVEKFNELRELTGEQLELFEHGRWALDGVFDDEDEDGDDIDPTEFATKHEVSTWSLPRDEDELEALEGEALDKLLAAWGYEREDEESDEAFKERASDVLLSMIENADPGIIKTGDAPADDVDEEAETADESGTDDGAEPEGGDGDE